MKKILILLFSTLLLAGCASAPKEEAADPVESDVVESVPEETESKKPAETDGPVTALKLEKDPVYEDGQLILFFTDHDIRYADNAAAYVGVITATAASSMNAAIIPSELTAADENGNRAGVVLEPAEPLAAGDYSLSCAFGSYVVNFDITID